MSDTDTSADLDDGGGNTIATTSGTSASPATLTANTWGYRVDGVGGFGAGPTTGSANSSIPIAQFAGIPLSSGAADTLATTSVAANPAVNTTVWFSLCADVTKPAATYTDTVIYTAVVN